MCSNRQTSLVNVIIKIQVDYLNLQFIIREEQTERDLYDIWDIFLSGGTYFIQIENFVRNYLFFLVFNDSLDEITTQNTMLDNCSQSLAKHSEVLSQKHNKEQMFPQS